jgi:hypothetical protein
MLNQTFVSGRRGGMTANPLEGKPEHTFEALRRVLKLAQRPPATVAEIRAHETFDDFWWEIRQLPVELRGVELVDLQGIRLIQDNDVPFGMVEMRWTNRVTTRHTYQTAAMRREIQR